MKSSINSSNIAYDTITVFTVHNSATYFNNVCKLKYEKDIEYFHYFSMENLRLQWSYPILQRSDLIFPA